MESLKKGSRFFFRESAISASITTSRTGSESGSSLLKSNFVSAHANHNSESAIDPVRSESGLFL